MIDLIEIAARLQKFCDTHNWRSCFIGGLAVQRWSEPRVTRDVNLTLLTGFGREDQFIDTLLSEYRSRIPNPKPFALRNRVLLLQSPENVGIDISLAALPFEELVVDHATDFSFPPGVSIRTCSAEDLMVLKLFASRPLDIRDAEGIALRNGKSLDWRYIEQQLRPLAELKEDRAILTTLAGLRELKPGGEFIRF